MRQRMIRLLFLALFMTWVILTIPSVRGQEQIFVSITPRQGDPGTSFVIVTIDEADCGFGTGPTFVHVSYEPGTHYVTCRYFGQEATGSFTVIDNTGVGVPSGSPPSESIPETSPPPSAPLPPLPAIYDCQTATWSYERINMRSSPTTGENNIVGALSFDRVVEAVAQVRTDEGTWYQVQDGDRLVWVAAQHYVQGTITRPLQNCPNLPIADSFVEAPECGDGDLQSWMAQLPYYILQDYATLPRNEACARLSNLYQESDELPIATRLSQDLPVVIFEECPHVLPELMLILERLERRDQLLREDITEAFNASSDACGVASQIVGQRGLPQPSDFELPEELLIELAPLTCSRGINDQTYDSLLVALDRLEISLAELQANTCGIIRTLTLLGSELPGQQIPLYTKLTSEECRPFVQDAAQALDFVVEAIATGIDIPTLISRLCPTSGGLSVQTLIREIANNLPTVRIPAVLVICHAEFPVEVVLFVTNHLTSLSTQNPAQYNELLSSIETAQGSENVREACLQLRTYLRGRGSVTFVPFPPQPGGGSLPPIPTPIVSSEVDVQFPRPSGGDTPDLGCHFNRSCPGDSPDALPVEVYETEAAAIVITEGSDGQPGNIYVLRAEQLVPLTQETGTSLDPLITPSHAVLSPDGRYALYYLSDSGGNVVSVRRVDILGLTDEQRYPTSDLIWLATANQIAAGTIAPFTPDWSQLLPTNAGEDQINRLLFTIYMGEEYQLREIERIDAIETIADSRYMSQIRDAAISGRSGVYHSQGFRIAFVQLENPSEIFTINRSTEDAPQSVTMNARGGDSVLPLGVNCENPRFGGGNNLYFTCGNAVYRHDAGTGATVNVTGTSEVVCENSERLVPGVLTDAFGVPVGSQICFIPGDKIDETDPRRLVENLFDQIDDVLGEADILALGWATPDL